MRSIWRIISTLILVTAFLILTVFSLEEYKGDNLDAPINTDKLPIATTALSVFSYLEKMPTIRLLPSITSGTEYEKEMNKILDKNRSEVPINVASVKQEVATQIKNNPQNIDLNSLGERLKASFNKDWSRP